MHITCAFTARRRLHYDHAVASDAGMTIAECRNLGGGKLELFFHSVKEHEVVAEAMKFPERIVAMLAPSLSCIEAHGAYLSLAYARNISRMFRERKNLRTHGSIDRARCIRLSKQLSPWGT